MDSDSTDPVSAHRVDAPIAFGYLRSEGSDEDQIESWDKEIRAFCGSDYVFAGVYCDRNCDGLELTRPGFAGVLDALALPISMALVVPDLTHLSSDTVVREALLQQVRRTGVRVLVTRQAIGHADTTDLNHHGVPITVEDGGEPS